MKKILCVGSGISSLTLANLFKKDDYSIEIHEKKEFIGGMAADFKCEDYYVSKFGPRFLRFSKETQSAKKFLEKFTKLVEYNHKVIALGNSNFCFWPPNKVYVDLFNKLNKSNSILDEFVYSYSKKVWDKDMKEVLGNIKDRFKFKDNYNTDFIEGNQGYMPNKGFTNLFRKLSKGMIIKYNEKDSISTIKPLMGEYDYIFISSPIDEFFKNKFGLLEYKKIKFSLESFANDGSNILLSTVMNYNTHPEIIRCTEYPGFYNSKSLHRLIGIERKSDVGVPCYPVITKKNLDRLKKYQDYAKKFPNLYFIGRLGMYVYGDFDCMCQKSLDLYKQLKGGDSNGKNKD